MGLLQHRAALIGGSGMSRKLLEVARNFPNVAVYIDSDVLQVGNPTTLLSIRLRCCFRTMRQVVTLPTALLTCCLRRDVLDV